MPQETRKCTRTENADTRPQGFIGSADPACTRQQIGDQHARSSMTTRHRKMIHQRSSASMSLCRIIIQRRRTFAISGRRPKTIHRNPRCRRSVASRGSTVPGTSARGDGVSENHLNALARFQANRIACIDRDPDLSWIRRSRSGKHTPGCSRPFQRHQ